ncbi:platelet-derived growth factor receptor-like protein isoform X2 [Protopterus annectens]|uniref:platelet-derived growth factor receptor-like protein isoform X2 n=1 Tax=Protopterus annectens TaxID=7888 RepID=UPI001CFBD8F9|nr:platelet-derived growth factor receptor-like protein isoform X2 [Protopterus annectens]
MKFWFIIAFLVCHDLLQNVVCQQKDKPNRPRGSPPKRRLPRPKDKDSTVMTRVMDKGRFVKLGSTLSVSAGPNIELRCRGTKIGWSYPAYLDTFKDSRLSIKQHDKYSQLVLQNSTAADTGEFSCWICEDSGCTKDESKSASTYIFFSGKGDIFVPSTSYFEIVYLYPDKAAIIPCRVTHATAKVTLHREVPAEEVIVDGTEIAYDIKKGFIIQNPSFEHKGVVYCKAALGGTSHMSIKYQLLLVEVPSGPPYVAIAGPNHVHAGANFNVTCTVLGEPEVQVDFNWIYPGEKDERPVTIQESSRLINRGTVHTTRMSQSIIIVQDFETIDTGDYMCTASNPLGETTVAVRVDSY